MSLSHGTVQLFLVSRPSYRESTLVILAAPTTIKYVTVDSWDVHLGLGRFFALGLPICLSEPLFVVIGADQSHAYPIVHWTVRWLAVWRTNVLLLFH